MSNNYLRDNLRIAVAQICQTIGYNSAQTTSLELLQDILQKFLNEFCRDLHRQMEHYNRTEANINDVYLTFKSLDINVDELLNYLNNVEPVPFAVELPKFPVQKKTNLNFLKDGSKEVLTRPVHVYEYLPSILPSDPPIENSRFNNAQNDENVDLKTVNVENIKTAIEDRLLNSLVRVKTTPSKLSELFKSSASSCTLDDEGRPTRELSSVVMTIGGFISPAIEGKLPETTIPEIIEKCEGLDAPLAPSTPHNPPSETRNFIQNSELIKINKSNIDLVNNSLTTVKTENDLMKQVKKVSGSNANASVVNKIIEPSDKTSIDTSTKKLLLSKYNIKNICDSKTFTSGNNPTNISSSKKLLKLSKKKKSIGSLEAHTKFDRDSVGAINQNNFESNVDKIQKKRIKLLQKIQSKCLKSEERNIYGLVEEDPTKVEVINSSMLSLSPGPERLHLEKFIKKQAKQKQKQIKQQLLIERQNNMVANNIFKTQKNLEYDISTNKMSKIFLESEKLKHPEEISLEQVNEMQVKTNSPHKINISGNVSPALSSHVNIQTANSKSMEQNCTASTEVKLSTEPDRTKLNIFKKISKQKALKALSPKNVKNLTIGKLNNTEIVEDVNFAMTRKNYTGAMQDSQVINLPTGTTITPTSPSVNEKAFSREFNLQNFDNIVHVGEFVGDQLSEIGITKSIPTLDYSSKISSDIKLTSINKPKKRGRKPGSKNQSKNIVDGVMTPRNDNKLKSLKKNKCSSSINVFKPDFVQEPLNLTNCQQFKDSHFIAAHQNEISNKFLQTHIKERKSRKKLKSRNEANAVNLQVSVGNRDLNKNSNVPSKEEVNTINKKLLRMDTVLKPTSVSLQHNSGDFNNVITNSTSNEVLTASCLKSPDEKKLAEQHQYNIKNVKSSVIFSSNMPPAPFLGSEGTSFSNLSPNMLSMLPLYSFPPRPGLIPTPGLFPTPNLGNFTNSPLGVTQTTGLIPGFLPFVSTRSNQLSMEKSCNEPEDSTNESTSKPVERNYCNVAPLVADTMNLIPAKDNIEDQNLCINEQDTIKTTQFVKSMFTSNVKDFSMKKGESFSSTDVSLPSSSSIMQSLASGQHRNSCFQIDVPSTVTISKSCDFENTNLNSKSITNLTTEKQTNINNFVSHVNTMLNNSGLVEKRFMKEGQLFNTSLNCNPNETIEVSDDSTDAPKTNFADKDIKFPNKDSTFSHIENIFMNKNVDATNKDMDFLKRSTKKQKKNFKTNKKNNFPCSISLTTSTPVSSSLNISSSLNLFSGSDKISGVGKLAGGADLIPLTVGTGLAYSSKTIPATSLTAAITPSPFPVNKLEDTPNIFNSLSITPSAHTIQKNNISNPAHASTILQKKRKEHKKLKKLKDGKIKKKKDKKDKLKNKEQRNEKFLLKTEINSVDTNSDKSTTKELLKKIKKEKKKDKQQRISVEESLPTSFSPVLHANIYNLDKTTTQAIPSSQSTSTNIMQNFISSNAVPKLTLKIGNSNSPTFLADDTHKEFTSTSVLETNEREKKELSPELARISPLVTRPPKSKNSTNEPVILNTTVSNKSVEIFNDSKKMGETCFNNCSKNQPLIPPSPWIAGGTLAASAVLLPQQLMQSSKIGEQNKLTVSGLNTEPVTDTTSNSTNIRSNSDRQSPIHFITEVTRPSSYIDAEGNRVWICPACGKVDDGSAMIGCDSCDAWYHWVCVGIFVAPKDNEDWFCRVCITRKRGLQGSDKKRKRNKKK